MNVVARLASMALALVVCAGSVVIASAPATGVVSESGAGTLSGTVRGRGGLPVPNVTIHVSIGSFSGSTTTNSLGQYSLATDSGPAFVQVQGSGPAGIAPDSFYLERYDIVVNGATAVDFNLSVAQVTGVVRNPDSTPSAGATLNFSTSNFLSNSRTASSADVTSATNGSYSVLLLTGAATGIVTPASPDGIAFAQDFVLAGDLVQNFQFIAAATVSGTVRGRSNLPVPGATVLISVAATTNAAVTDSAGHYAMLVPNGPAFVQVQGGGPAGVAPDNFVVERYDLVVSGPTVFDLNLSVAQVSGLVKNPDGTASAGASLNFSTFDFPTNGRTASSADATSAADGSYSVLLLTGSATGVATPASPGIALAQDFAVTGNTVEDFQFTAAVTVSGTVRGRSSQPVPGAVVIVSVGSTTETAVTDSAGHYSVQVATGPAFIQIQGGGPAGTAPADFSVERYDVVVSGPTVVDVDLPVVNLQGIVKTGDGTGIGSALVTLVTNGNPAGGRTTSNVIVTTSGTGAYSALVLSGSVQASVTPPSGSGLTVLTRTFSVAADATEDFVLSSLTTLSGTVRGRGGVVIPNLSVSATVDSTTTNGLTDANGQYSLSVPNGSATVEVSGTGAGAPSSFIYLRSGVTVNGATTVDVDLPVAEVSGLVTDANGVAIPGIVVTASSTDAQSDHSSASTSFATSAADGTFSYLLFTGIAEESIAPPAGSGFADGAQTLSVAADLTQQLIVQHNDVTPPVLTTGPVVVHLSAASATIAWSTNRASTSTVEFGVGSLSQSSDDGTLTTDHIVTLTGLSPAAPYMFRVGSTDATGNGPAFSSVRTFTTQAVPGDAAAPVITSGPALVFAGQATAILEWTTDEPSTSVVEYGAPPVTVDGDPGHFRFVHRVTLTGLAPATSYTALVRSTDPDGNATASLPFTFTTLAAPDVAAPTITVGPTAVAVTDTRIVIAWTTGEPASGGVSFNDGTAYDLVRNEEFSRSHQLTLADLTPGTTYHITVSSTDPEGNGPVLSATFDVTTAAAPDATAPAISAVQTSDVSSFSAVVSWTTDEFANAVATFGRIAGNPDSVQADVVLATPHQLLLNGLQPGTPYFFVLASTDIAGNTTHTAELSFTTPPVIIDLPPTAPSPVSGPTSPTRLATIHISWGAATDDFGVASYEVYRDAVLIGSVPPATHAFDDTTAGEGTHIYRVGALDTFGHLTLSVPLTIVVDRTPPTLNLPGNLVADAILFVARVTYSVSATDNLDATVPVSCSPASGSFFLLGVTTVSCTSTDTAGNTGTGTFTVTVRDVTPPFLAVPSDITREATAPSGAVVSFVAVALDLVDGVVWPVCSPASGATFALGTTTVSCTATDAAGNATTKSFTVRVVDTNAPVITLFKSSQSVLWPANHQMVPLTLNVTVHDTADPSPVCTIVSISSNEPISGTGSGDLAPDWTFSGLSFSLRAERRTNGNGRVYTIRGQCRDASGNVTLATTTVSVPKNQPH